VCYSSLCYTASTHSAIPTTSLHDALPISRSDVHGAQHQWVDACEQAQHDRDSGFGHHQRVDGRFAGSARVLVIGTSVHEVVGDRRYEPQRHDPVQQESSGDDLELVTASRDGNPGTAPPSRHSLAQGSEETLHVPSTASPLGPV